MELRTLNDIYRCPHCSSIAAHGDFHCRGCGIKFSNDDVSMMANNKYSPVGALPWNTRDRYQCVHCEKYIAISDSFCRGCGDEIEDHEKQLMQLKLSELAKQNRPALIGLGLFVLFVVWASIQVVK